MYWSRMDRSVAHRLLERFKQKAGDKIVKPVQNRIRSARTNTRRKKNKLRTWYKSEGAQYVTYLKPYSVYVFIYGFLLNYTLYILLSSPLTIYTVPAWGIAYYFMKEEFTEFVLTIRGIRN